MLFLSTALFITVGVLNGGYNFFIYIHKYYVFRNAKNFAYYLPPIIHLFTIGAYDVPISNPHH